jgi:hypothetical protein
METTTEKKTGELYSSQVWRGCLSCYNSGRLTGAWVKAVELAELATECVVCSGDEWAAMDADAGSGRAGAVLVRMLGENVSAWSEFAQAVFTLGVDEGELERALLMAGHLGNKLGSLEMLLDETREAYAGTIDVHKFSGGLDEAVGVWAEDELEAFSEVPKHLRYYIDHERYGRDLLLGDMFAVEDGNGYALLFWNH